MDSFSTSAQKALSKNEGKQYYVYALFDPRLHKVFYIGKGKGNRIFNHNTKGDDDIETFSKKKLIIKDIVDLGFEVQKVIINYNLTEEEAFAAEASLINLVKYQGDYVLSNIVSGHHCSEAIAVEKFEKINGAEVISSADILYNVLAIKINKSYNWNMDIGELKEHVRGHWKINVSNAKKCDYIFAIYEGLVVGVFNNCVWYNCFELTDFYPRKEEFNGLQKSNRKYCTCDIVEDCPYLWKNIKEFTSKTQNPISYIWNKPKNNE